MWIIYNLKWCNSASRSFSFSLFIHQVLDFVFLPHFQNVLSPQLRPCVKHKNSFSILFHFCFHYHQIFIFLCGIQKKKSTSDFVAQGNPNISQASLIHHHKCHTFNHAINHVVQVFTSLFVLVCL